MKKEYVLRPKNLKETRNIVEKARASWIVDLETTPEADKIKHLESGLTPVIARYAARTGTGIGIDVEALKHHDRITKAHTLARIRQNIELCRKANALLGIHAKREAQAILLSLGASTYQAASAKTQSF